MGADGGSFTHRSEVVKTKAKVETVDKHTQQLVDWFTCALSKEELQEPLVSDALGKLYNKDAIIEFLLAPAPSPENPISSRPFGQDGWLAAGHLRSLKDVQTLKLNPANTNSTMRSGSDQAASTSSTSSSSSSLGRARWQCPISMRAMNGSVRFVYIRGCGCVVSEAGLNQVIGGSGGRSSNNGKSRKDGKPSPSSDKENSSKSSDREDGDVSSERAHCPICDTLLPGTKVETVTINPVGEEKEAMTRAWSERVAREEKDKAEKRAAKKNGKKRKDAAAAAGEDGADADAATRTTATASKKVKVSTTTRAHAHAPAPAINKKLPTIPDATKKPISPAIASLYAPKDANKEKLSPLFSSGYSRVG